MKITRSTWYSLVYIAPLVFIYEVLAIVVNWNSSGPELRNGADILVRFFFKIFGLSTPYITALILLVALALVWYFHVRQHGSHHVSGSLLGLMLIESCVWAIVLLVVLAVTDNLLMLNTADEALAAAYLAVGAGLYEEAVFRLLLVSGLALFFIKVMLWKNFLAWAVAVMIGAMLFSLFHFIGLSDEVFAWNTFVYRGVGGALLGTLYISRGFGITVYAHTIYDLLVLTIRTVN
ncbi:hypothetical protein ACFL6E_06040 [Candidatus Neomarinimicrobiota bacterium]